MSTSLKLSNKDVIDLDLMCKMMTFTISHAFSTGLNCVPSLYTHFEPHDIDRIKKFVDELIYKVVKEDE